MLALLEHRCVINHQHSVTAAHELVRLNNQFSLNRSRIPDPGRDEVVQPIVRPKRKPLGHRLNALAITRTDQSRYVSWAHPPPRLVPQSVQKRPEPALQVLRPIQCCPCHGRPPKPTTHE